MRKAWSTRVRRWLKMMPREMLDLDPWQTGTRRRVKEWVKDNVGRRGEDPVLWGRWALVTDPGEGEHQTGEHEEEERC